MLQETVKWRACLDIWRHFAVSLTFADANLPCTCVLGQIYSTNLNNPKDKVYSTKESSSKEDDSYLGYSSVSGDFTGDGISGVAVGMPRGGGLLGKVLVFSWNLTNQVNITGEQIGAYFGYSLCSVDVDGDKLEDLIVGAPMYTEPNNEGKFETGRVYIVYQSKFVR